MKAIRKRDSGRSGFGAYTIFGIETSNYEAIAQFSAEFPEYPMNYFIEDGKLLKSAKDKSDSVRTNLLAGWLLFHHSLAERPKLWSVAHYDNDEFQRWSEDKALELLSGADSDNKCYLWTNKPHEYPVFEYRRCRIPDNIYRQCQDLQRFIEKKCHLVKYRAMTDYNGSLLIFDTERSNDVGYFEYGDFDDSKKYIVYAGDDADSGLTIYDERSFQQFYEVTEAAPEWGYER